MDLVRFGSSKSMESSSSIIDERSKAPFKHQDVVPIGLSSVRVEVVWRVVHAHVECGAAASGEREKRERERERLEGPGAWKEETTVDVQLAISSERLARHQRGDHKVQGEDDDNDDDEEEVVAMDAVLSEREQLRHYISPKNAGKEAMDGTCTSLMRWHPRWLPDAPCRHETAISAIFLHLLDLLDDKFGSLIYSAESLVRERTGEYCTAVHAKGAPLGCVVGFIDGVRVEI